MIKKFLLVLMVLVLTSGIVFAQSNAVTVDFGPLIAGLAFGAAGSVVDNLTGDDVAITTETGFGIGGQYERQITKQLSAALRGAYLGTSFGLVMTDDRGVTAPLDMGLKSFSVEGHVRFYPTGDGFFVGGLVGFGNLAADLNGEINFEKYNQKLKENIDFSPSRSYIKAGARLGARLSFCKGIKFVFEPSLGYTFPIGMGDSIPEQVAVYLDEKTSSMSSGIPSQAGTVDIDISDFSDVFDKYVANMVFIGGPKLSLAFGLRF
jgi:hypothetical protein